MDRLFESEESRRRYHIFTSSWHQSINAYHQRFGHSIILARSRYPLDLLQERDRLEKAIKKSLTNINSQIPEIWTAVEKWGGFRPMVEKLNSHEHVIEVTVKAFERLTSGMLREAAQFLVDKLVGVGISRATKMLALSDQRLYGIYDSRAGDGLRSLTNKNGRPLIPVPYGRRIQGTSGDKALGFENYTWVLRYMLSLFQAQSGCKDWKTCDVEIGLFML